MRDDAVLRRALPLGRGLGRSAEEQIVKRKIRVPSAAASNCLGNPQRLAARDLSRAIRSRKPILTYAESCENFR